MLGNTVSEGISCGIMLLLLPEHRNLRPARRRCTPTPRRSCTASLAGRGQPPAGQRPAGCREQPDPYTLATLYTGSRAAAMAQYGRSRDGAAAAVFPFSVLSGLSGLLMPEITRAHTRGTPPPCRRAIFTMLR